MKSEYIKIISLLIALFYVNILEINNLRRKKNASPNNISKDDYVRLLKGDYDTSGRSDQNDINSIENCEDSSEDYFSYYRDGKNFVFDKFVDQRDSVNNYLL